MLVVIAIIITLFSLVAISMGLYKKIAYEKATTALLQRLQQHLDEYRSLTGHYPPDGIDSPQQNAEGTRIQGAACLHYFLTNPITVEEVTGGVRQPKVYPPIIAKMKENELTPEDPASPGVREIADAWANPLHYDNTEDGVFRPQRGEVHSPPLDDSEHPLDPRVAEFKVGDERGAGRPGEVQSTGYDLWSHDGQGHSVVEDEATLPIASWNIKE
jgi:type II secretory pathway pseudopilin PulG